MLFGINSVKCAVFEKLKPHFVPVIFLLLITFAVYAKCLRHEFLVNWDDEQYVTMNETIRGFTFEHLKSAFSGFFIGNYAPVHLISYMLDYTLWGLNPAGFLLVNILLHATNGVLYYGLIAKLTKLRVLGFLASFIFLIHPVQVESVAWVSERKNLLSLCFFLISFLLYILSKEKTEGEERRLYFLSLTAFLIALLTKSVAVILPLLLVMYDLCFTGRVKKTGKLPFFLLSIAIAVITVISQSRGLGGGRVPYHGGSLFTTFITMMSVPFRYLALIFWPVRLSSVYDPPVKTAIDGDVLWAMSGLFALVVLAFWLYRIRRDLFFWLVFFFIALLPVAQIVPIASIMNDRYLYFPMVGMASFVVIASSVWFSAAKGQNRFLGRIIIAIALLILSVLTLKNIDRWKNSMTLWNDAVQKSPKSTLAWTGLADTYRLNGNAVAALNAYSIALSIDPLNSTALLSSGILEMEHGNLFRSRSYLVLYTRNYPGDPEGFFNLAMNYELSGAHGNALAAYRKALELDPNSPRASAIQEYQARQNKDARQDDPR